MVTNENLAAAIASSSTWKGVLEVLNLPSSSFTSIKKRAIDLKLDTSHISQKPRRDITEYISNKVRIYSFHLKERLLNENILEEKCSYCGITEWNGKPAPLELDHIDGNPDNNLLENLRILCPNCHAQTPTYCIGSGKNNKNKRVYKCNTCGSATAGRTRSFCSSCWQNEKLKRKKLVNTCIDCKKEISNNSLRCTPCRFSNNRKTKLKDSKCLECSKPIFKNRIYCSVACQRKKREVIQWPNNLPELSKGRTITQVAKELNVSRHAVMARLRIHHNMILKNGQLITMDSL